MLRIDVDDEQARELFTTIDDGVEKAESDILEDLGEETRKSIVRQLFRQGSVSTGTGHRSLTVRPAGEGTRKLYGRSYLLGLDQGTRKHRPRRNFRFRFWASEQGWTPDTLAKHISKYGTRPNPFISKSVDRAVIKLDDIALKHIQKHTED